MPGRLTSSMICKTDAQKKRAYAIIHSKNECVIKAFGENTIDITKNFCKSLGKSCKQLWTGKPGTSGFMKHAGKAYVIFAALLTAALTGNTILRAKHMAKDTNKHTIDPQKESTVI